MLGVSQARIDLHDHLVEETGDLLRTLVNAGSLAEAGFALSLVRDIMPERTVMTALNLREVLLELPAAPFVMAVDTAVLEDSLGLERDCSSYVMHGDGFRIDVLAEGNFCFDIVLKVDDQSVFLKTSPAGDDIVKPAAYEVLMNTDGALERVIELVMAMGLVFNPRLYFTVDEWLGENALDTMTELWDAFRRLDA
jgi:hypothetical protein